MGRRYLSGKIIGFYHFIVISVKIINSYVHDCRYIDITELLDNIIVHKTSKLPEKMPLQNFFNLRFRQKYRLLVLQ